MSASTALHLNALRAVDQALYGEELVLCDVTGCGEPVEEGLAYCSEHRACGICGAIGGCATKACDFNDENRDER